MAKSRRAGKHRACAGCHRSPLLPAEPAPGWCHFQDRKWPCGVEGAGSAGGSGGFPRRRRLTFSQPGWCRALLGLGTLLPLAAPRSAPGSSLV